MIDEPDFEPADPEEGLRCAQVLVY